MSRSAGIIKIAVVVLLAMIIFTVPLVGQSLWLKHNHKPAISLEFYKIKYERDPWYGTQIYNTKLFNMTAFLSAYIPTSHDLGVVFEIPYTNFSIQAPDASMEWGNYSENSIGNPYIGIEYENPEQNFISTVGIRFPLASEENPYALLQGMRTESDRAEAFEVKRLAIYASAVYNYRSPEGLTLRFGLGPLASIPTKTGEYDTELYLRYFSQLWTEAGNFSMAAGLTGFFWLTGEDLNLGEGTFHHINLAGFYQFGMFRPGLFFAAPLDANLSYIKDYTYGFSLTLEFENSFR
ncbi:MAG: hypothetical protein JXA92_07570 [candidate division Zixibacteria bacterium]|nr:hypothetical protein [candidate division Zixibacteria bacterium]